MGIEPTYPAWKAGVLPLNYTRTGLFLIQPRDNTILCARLSTAFHEKICGAPKFPTRRTVFTETYRALPRVTDLCARSAT